MQDQSLIADIIANWPHYQTIAIDRIWTGIVWVTLAYAAGTVLSSIKNYVKNRWLSNIGKYEGAFFAYRWHANSPDAIVKPKVDIFRRTRFSPYKLRWTTPDGVSSIYPLIEHTGREIYAYGRARDLGSFSFFVLHPAHSVPVDLVSGVYTFMNMSHEMISGRFLLSRHELTDSQVQELMEPSLTRSSQADAHKRFLKYQDMKFSWNNLRRPS